MRITDYLARDHERLHALLRAASAGPSFDASAFEAFRAGLLRHIGIEEKLLLPAARRARGGEPLERARALRIDHAALSSLMVPTPDAALCAEIAGILDGHDAVEEGPSGVYAECESLLSSEESAALAARAAATPDVPLAPHFDGAGTHRMAASALAAARRIKRTPAKEER
jgi:hypothetical protein